MEYVLTQHARDALENRRIAIARLECVLEPAGAANYYEAFNIVPSALLDKLREGKVLVCNWRVLAWGSEEQIKKRHSHALYAVGQEEQPGS